MHSRTHDLLAHSWQSQANLSFFLFLLILLGFVLPSFGVERSNLRLYADIAFCVVSVAGAAIAWGNRRPFVLTSLVAVVAIALRWATWRKPTNTLILWSELAGLVAIVTITVVLLWQVFRHGPVTWMRIQGAMQLICALGSPGHTHTASLHYWILALSAMQGAMSRSRQLGSTIVLEC